MQTPPMAAVDAACCAISAGAAADTPGNSGVGARLQRRRGGDHLLQRSQAFGGAQRTGQPQWAHAVGDRLLAQRRRATELMSDILHLS